MPKAPKKLSTKSRRKRPKSVYAKGWETRRARARAWKVLASPTKEQIMATIDKTLRAETDDPKAAQAAGWTPVTVAEAAQIQEAMNQHRSEQADRAEMSGGDALLRLTMLHRDEQLCGFMGDMQAARHRGGLPSHAPMLVTRSQIEAIEDLLGELGYSRFGKGSGSLATVSTNPFVTAA